MSAAWHGMADIHDDDDHTQPAVCFKDSSMPRSRTHARARDRHSGSQPAGASNNNVECSRKEADEHSS
jgi:hypothetical protein